MRRGGSSCGNDRHRRPVDVAPDEAPRGRRRRRSTSWRRPARRASPIVGETLDVVDIVDLGRPSHDPWGAGTTVVVVVDIVGVIRLRFAQERIEVPEASCVVVVIGVIEIVDVVDVEIVIDVDVLRGAGTSTSTGSTLDRLVGHRRSSLRRRSSSSASRRPRSPGRRLLAVVELARRRCARRDRARSCSPNEVYASDASGPVKARLVRASEARAVADVDPTRTTTVTSPGPGPLDQRHEGRRRSRPRRATASAAPSVE